jgi:prephenate dehydratase
MTTLAYLGPEGTFSHVAAKRSLRGRDAQLVAVQRPIDILRGVELGHFDSGIVPIEHSTLGADTASLDALLAICQSSQIVEEVRLQIGFSAYVSSVWTREPATYVLSHPNALSQCSDFVDSLNATVVTTESTADACQRVARMRDPFVIALAPTNDSIDDELRLLKRDVGNDVDAVSRFVVVAKATPTPTAQSISTIVLTPSTTRSGSLVAMLTPFADAGVNVRELIARPLGTHIGEYRFVITCDGHVQESPLDAVIDALLASDVDVRVLGSFDAAT